MSFHYNLYDQVIYPVINDKQGNFNNEKVVKYFAEWMLAERDTISDFSS